MLIATLALVRRFGRRLLSQRWVNSRFASQVLTIGVWTLLLPGIALGQNITLRGPNPVHPASDPPAPSTVESIEHDTLASRVAGGTSRITDSDSVTSAPLPLITDFQGHSLVGAFIDESIAAGPISLVLTNNGSVTIRSKAGAMVANTTLFSFFSTVTQPGEGVGDVRALFDPLSGRFFISALAIRGQSSTCTLGTCVSHFLLAVSKTSSPVSFGPVEWYLYALDATLDGATPTTRYVDFPGLGVSDEVIVLTGQMFPFGEVPTGFNKVMKIRILDKSKLVSGASVTWTDFVGVIDPSDGMPARGALQPTQQTGSPGVFFVLGGLPNAACGIIIWAIQNPLSSPTLTGQLLQRPCTPTGLNAPQPGGAPSSMQPIFAIPSFIATAPFGSHAWLGWTSGTGRCPGFALRRLMSAVGRTRRVLSRISHWVPTEFGSSTLRSWWTPRTTSRSCLGAPVPPNSLPSSIQVDSEATRQTRYDLWIS